LALRSGAAPLARSGSAKRESGWTVMIVFERLARKRISMAS
jgi:hypothetical protein